MRKKLSAFLLVGILFFAGRAEGVSAAQISSGDGKEYVQEEVFPEYDIPKNTGGAMQLIRMEAEQPEESEIYKGTRSGKSKGSKSYSSPYDAYSTNFYYNQLEGVYHVRTCQECKEALEHIISANNNIDQEKVKCFFQAIYEYSESINVGYGNYDELENAKKMAVLLSRTIG